MNSFRRGSVASSDSSQPVRVRRVDRDWINIGVQDDDEDDSEVREYLDLPSYRFRTSLNHPDKALEIQAKAYEKLKRASDEHEADKKGEVGRLSVHSHPENVHTTLPLEWYTFRIGSMGVGFDLELWWRKSANFLRLHAIFLLLIFLIFLCQAGAGVFFIVKHFSQTVRSPYVCDTKDCKAASHFLTQAMNKSVDPCDNFYEFVCGSYEEPQTQNLKFAQLISDPGFKLELGGPSLLSKILKDFRNDPTYDQSIKYYQSCLDEEQKKEHGIKSLLVRMEYIFGTRDLNAFNSGTEDMEEVAIRLYQVVGHAYFLNMAFSTFPYIQFIGPNYASTFDLVYWNSSNELYVRKVYNFLLPQLGLQANSPEIEELVRATHVWADTLYIILSFLKRIDLSKENASLEYRAVLIEHMDGHCPPMGIKLNLDRVLTGFLQTQTWEWEYQYFDISTQLYWIGIKWCFDHDVPLFNWTKLDISPQRSRLDFVSIWLIGLFQDIVPVMHNDFILSYTQGLTDRDWNKIPLAQFQYFVGRKVDVEYKCLNEVWTALGYLPSLRYLSANVDDPVDFLLNNIEDIQKLYKFTRQLYWSIPQDEIHPFMARQGELMFRRELQAEILMPLVGDILDTFRDYLHFTDDHLNNHYVALNLTIQSGRQYWLASTDRLRSPKWWGYGGLQIGMRDQLLDLKTPFIDPARFLEKKGAFTAGEWDKFVGRNDFNYILFPLSLYNEPHISETLALKSAGSTLKIIRTLLSIIGRIAEYGTYPFFMDWHPINDVGLYLPRRAEMRFDGGNGYNEYPINNSAQCSTLVILRKEFDKIKSDEEKYEYRRESHVIQQVSSNDHPEILHLFLNVMAVKFAFKHFTETRKKILAYPYSSELKNEERKYRMNRLLPDPMLKYSEEQIFFMGLTRHLCLQSWKKTSDHMEHTKKARYQLEVDVLNMLANSEEFRKAFKCKRNSMMNNMGQPKCFKWVP